MPRPARRPAAVSRCVAALTVTALLTTAGCREPEPEADAPEAVSAATGTGAGTAAAPAAGAEAPPADGPIDPAGTWRVVSVQQGRGVNYGTVTIADRDGTAEVVGFEGAQLAQLRPTVRSSSASEEGVLFVLDADAADLPGGLTFDFRPNAGTFVGALVTGPDQPSLPVRLLPLAPGEPNPGPAQVEAPEYAAAMSEIADGDPMQNVQEVARRRPANPALFDAFPRAFQTALQQDDDDFNVRSLADGFARFAEGWHPRLAADARSSVVALTLRSGKFPELAERFAAEAVADLPADAAAERTRMFEQLREQIAATAAREELAGRVGKAVELAEAGDAEQGLSQLRALAEENPDEGGLADGLALAVLRYGGENRLEELRALHERRPYLSATTFMLAEAEREDGDRDAARDRLAEVVAAPGGLRQVNQLISGMRGENAPVPPQVRLEALFEGTDEEFGDLLDAAYERSATAFADEPKAADPSDRTVLVELFTGSQCPPCVPADLATAALAETYPAEDLIVLQYHVHVPGPDPLTNEATTERLQALGIGGTPTVLIDGVQSETPAPGAPEQAREKYAGFAGEIDARRSEPAGATVEVSAEADGDVTTLSATAARDGGFTGEHRLHVAVAEREVRYAARNGVRFHEMLVRALPAGVDGAAPGEDGSLSFEAKLSVTELRDTLAAYLAAYEQEGGFEFPVKPLDLTGLEVVAWVTDGPDGPVLQAARAPIDGLAPPAPATEQPQSEPAEDGEPTTDAAPAEEPAADPAATGAEPVASGGDRAEAGGDGN